MGLQFIIGPAGSGKTRYIVESIVDRLITDGDMLSDLTTRPLPNMLFLVPDQATFQMEKRVLEETRLKGFMRLQVLSFRRMAWKVLEETGGVTVPFMTAVGRNMALQSILWQNRKALTVFAPLVNYPGFRDTLSQALQELYAYDIAPEDLQKTVLTGREVPFLEQKVQDLATVYREYALFLKGRFLDPNDSLRLSAEKMGGSSLVKGATIFVDGFSGFTPDEYRVLEAVMEHAQDVHVALCMDRAETLAPLGETSLFHPVRDTYEKLREIAWKRGVLQYESVHLGETDGESRFRSHELAVLEDGLRRWGGHRAPVPANRSEEPVTPLETRAMAGAVQTRTATALLTAASAGGVHILAAANPLTEVEFVAREILRLVRDEGYRYRDITVETRETEPYADIISLVFRDHGIPFFLDRKRPLSHHPLSELLRSAMDAALTGFSSEAVFRYLKTDLVPVDRESVDILENYVLAHGITGERWISEAPWRYRRRYTQREDLEPEGREEAEFCDSIRRSAAAHLSTLYRSLSQQKPLTASAISRALYDLLIDLDVPGSLGKWQDEAEAQGDLASALEHAGLWDRVMEILEQAGEILKDENCDLSTYALILEAGLEDVRLGVIPPSLDQVLVGTLDRSRQPECAATFLVGALAGSFPKRHFENGIFTDSERGHLEKRGFTLDPGSRVKQLHEKYLVYIALTRPSLRLYMSYPLGDQEGNALEPSHIVGVVRRILGDKKETFIPHVPLAEDLDCVVPARIRGLTVRQLADKKPDILGSVWAEALRWLTDPIRENDVRPVLEALSFKNQVPPLSRIIVKALYGETLKTSVSRLESFAACPFSHFASNGLRLREREIYRLEPADAGTFLHEALREFVAEVSGANMDWAALAKEDAGRIADRVTERLVPRVQDEIFMSSARYSYVASVLKRITRRAAEVLTEHRKQGEFVPAALEARFGFDGGIPPMRLSLEGGDQVLLRGQIDRIDALVQGGATYLRVIDYKSSPRPLDLTDVYHGLSLQLLIYLLVALESWPKIAGAVGGLAAQGFPGQVWVPDSCQGLPPKGLLGKFSRQVPCTS